MSLITEASRVRAERAKLIMDHWSVAGALSRAVSSNVESQLQRWLYELLQNADDAEATRCEIILRDEILIVADDGKGLNPACVESLSTPFQSDKTGLGTIGRKGVGFSAVYDLSHQPLIVSGGEGLIFSPDRFSRWLFENAELSRCSASFGDYPLLYALVPFGVTVTEIDELMPEFGEMDLDHLATKVCLRIRQDRNVRPQLSSMACMDFSFLLTFNHLRHLAVIDGGAGADLEIRLQPRSDTLSPDSAEAFTLTTVKRGSAPAIRHFARWSKTIQLPSDLLLTEIAEPKARGAMESITLRLMASSNDEGSLDHFDSKGAWFLVYYPTEDRSPLRAITHADFLVESNRKQILRPSACALNDHLMGELACFVAEVANRLSLSGRWPEAITLLEPADSSKISTEGLPSGCLWEKLKREVGDRLSLPTNSGRHVPAKQLLMIPTEGLPDALHALAEMRLPGLSHAADDLSQDDKARRVLESLGVRVLSEKQVTSWLQNPLPDLQGDPLEDWLWNAWLHLAEWLARQPSYKADETKKVMDSVKVVPIGGAAQARGRRVCWSADADAARAELPEWLPVSWLPEGLELRLRRAVIPTALRSMLLEIGITPLSPQNVLEALREASQSFWKKPPAEQVNPERFIEFLRQQSWLKTAVEEAFYEIDLGDIPVPATHGKSSVWRKAREVYLGSAWKNHDLHGLFETRTDVAWLAPGAWAHRSLYLALRVSSAPRLVKPPHDPLGAGEWERIRSEIPATKGGENRKNPDKKCLNKSDLRSQALVFDGFRVRDLSDKQQTCLLRILFNAWADFLPYKTLRAEFSYHGQFIVEIDNLWWHEVKTKLRPPQDQGALGIDAPLVETWLPKAPDWARFLFPTVDLAKIGEPEDEVASWLNGAAGVRQGAEDTTLDEWVEWTKLLPECLREMGEKSALNFVRHFYAGFLGRVARERKCTSSGPLSHQMPCWLGSELTFRNSAEVWLVGKRAHFDRWREEVPLLLLEQKHVDDASRCFGSRRLEDVITEEMHEPFPETEDVRLRGRICDVLPFLFSDDRRRRQEQVGLANWRRLKCYVADAVQVLVTLNTGNHPSLVERREVFGDKGSARFVVDFRSAVSPRKVAQGLQLALGLSEAAVKLAELLLFLPDPVSMRERLREDGIDDEEIEEDLNRYLHGEAASFPRAPKPEINDGRAGEPERLTTGQNESAGISDNLARELKLSLRSPGTGELPERGYAGGSDFDNRGQRRSFGQVPGRTQSTGAGSELSMEQKHQIEDAAREWVVREMEKEGYQVTPMPRMNPGYDLVATRPGETLHVEVMGHKGANNTFEITETEWRESEDPGDGVGWMLWLVENLDGTSKDRVRITPISKIRNKTPTAYHVRVEDCEAAVWPPAGFEATPEPECPDAAV